MHGGVPYIIWYSISVRYSVSLSGGFLAKVFLMEAAVRKLEALVRFKPNERIVHQMRFVCLVRENR